MYRGLFTVKLEIEDRQDDLLFISDKYEEAEKFFNKKFEEMKKDPSLEYGYECKNNYLVDFIFTKSFLDEDLLEHCLKFANDMFYSNGVLHFGNGNTECMTDAEFEKMLKEYIQ